MTSIGIIGSVGIPANYGGFETLTEHLTKNLGKIINFTVYCSSQAYKSKLKTYNNAKLVYIPLKGNGIQSIFYDIVSLFEAAKNNETILILGVSGCIVLPIFKLFYRKKHLIINIDGLEHRREKWNRSIKWFLKLSEKFAISFGSKIITDNEAIKKYVLTEYNTSSTLIAYAGDHVEKIPLSQKIKERYNIPDKYAIKVCRIEPENNIKLVLDAFKNSSMNLIIIGNWSSNKYGIALKKEYGNINNILLMDPIYDQIVLNQIRSNGILYLHGHSAGGTNPALVEAMNLGLPVFTYDCPYNRETTFGEAVYFKDSFELKLLIQKITTDELFRLGKSMYKIAKKNYTWENICNQYYKMLIPEH